MTILKRTIIPLFLACLLPGYAAAEDKVELVCDLEGDWEFFVTVDFKASTVDKHNALITDRLVSWEIITEDSKSSYILNRFTGTLMALTEIDGRADQVNGKCGVAKRKF